MSDKIKSRKSYKEFKTLAKLAQKGDIPLLLHTVYTMLDTRSAYGSRTMSLYAEESLKEVLKELTPSYKING